MPFPSNILGILFALTSAAVWGGGDFTGGYASRRLSPFQVLVLSALSGLVVLIAAAGLWRESFPSTRGIIFAIMAGALDALGIAALYRALSMGHAASVAPTSAVISAILPVVFGIFVEGMPALTKLLGFGLALAGIWLVSAATTREGRVSRQEFLLACLAGLGFGGFLIFLGLVEPGKIFTPLIVCRCLTLAIALLFTGLYRLPLPSLSSNPTALLAGLLDAGGNLFYVLARQFTRLDIAAVLTSFYPASTVLLASVIVKEKVSLSQWIGLLLCLAAIILITKG